jgi:hypothetical protein
LAVVWSLARDLVVEPALEQPLVWRGGIRQTVLLVVRLNKIFDDSAGL